MNAINWRGQATDPAALLAKYRMSIVPGPVIGWTVDRQDVPGT